jgi:HK97 family phage portal protein
MGKKTNISRWDAVSRPFKKWGAWLRGIRVSADSSPLSPYMNDIDFGVTVTNGSALKLSAFFAGIRLIAENIASLPKSVKKVDSYGSSTSDKAHAANKVLHHPNQYTNAITFWMTIVSWLKGWGNAYAIIKRDYRGVPVALHQVHPSNVEITLSKGRKWYKVTIADPDFKFLEGIYSDENMLHFMEMSLDGIIGVNTVIYNAMALGKSLAQEKFAGEFYRKGGNIKAVLETDGNLGDEAYSTFLKHFQAASNFETPLLEYGIKYKQLSVNPVAAQLVQSETMSIQDIARILNVPPHMIAELSHATFSNIEHQTIQFVQYSLRPVVRKIEVELESKLLFDSERDMVSIKFSLDGLLRGDTTARSAFYHNAILDGYMTRNEVRSLEGLEHAAGLDDFLVPLNVASIDEEGNIRENTAPAADNE